MTIHANTDMWTVPTNISPSVATGETPDETNSPFGIFNLRNRTQSSMSIYPLAEGLDFPPPRAKRTVVSVYMEPWQAVIPDRLSRGEEVLFPPCRHHWPSRCQNFSNTRFMPASTRGDGICCSCRATGTLHLVESTKLFTVEVPL